MTVTSTRPPASGAHPETATRPVLHGHTARLPWPFPDDLDAFRYSVNVEPARVPRRTAAGEWGAHIVDLGGEEYGAIMADRRRILDADPCRPPAGRVRDAPGHRRGVRGHGGGPCRGGDPA